MYFPEQGWIWSSGILCLLMAWVFMEPMHCSHKPNITYLLMVWQLWVMQGYVGELTLKHLSICFQNFILFSNVFSVNVFFVWNGINTMDVNLWVLMAWCFSTSASVATVLSTHPCDSSCLWVNSLIYRVGGCKFKYVISWIECILWTYTDVIQQDFIDYKSTSVWLMAWCLMAPSHYLNQCWPSSLIYGSASN